MVLINRWRHELRDWLQPKNRLRSFGEPALLMTGKAPSSGIPSLFL